VCGFLDDLTVLQFEIKSFHAIEGRKLSSEAIGKQVNDFKKGQRRGWPFDPYKSAPALRSQSQLPLFPLEAHWGFPKLPMDADMVQRRWQLGRGKDVLPLVLGSISTLAASNAAGFLESG